MTPEQLRTHYRSRRQAIPDKARQLASQQLCQHLQSLDLTQHQHVGSYLSHECEIDLSPIHKYLWQQNIALYLPVLHPILPKQLLWAQYMPNTKMTCNQYGIAEPILQPGSYIAPWELDIVLAPLVAFDANCYRMGMGAGYYDRAFAFSRYADFGVQLIGCGYACQQTDHLQVQPWDIPMHHIATETGIITCG